MILFALFLAYSITKCFRKHQKYTNITTTRLYTSAGLIIYTLYTGLSTRIFRLFKCQLIQGKYYLVADYRQICFEPNWNIYAIVAGVGGLIYVIGIPLVELSILYYNRKRFFNVKFWPKAADCKYNYKRKVSDSMPSQKRKKDT